MDYLKLKRPISSILCILSKTFEIDFDRLNSFLEPCRNKMVAVRHVATCYFQLIYICFKCFYDSLQQRCMLEFLQRFP